MRTDPQATIARATVCHHPSPLARLVITDSLATKPSSGTTPIIESTHAPAAVASSGSERPTPDSRRKSREPVACSTAPTVMNRADLNTAWATSMTTPAAVTAPSPNPKSRKSSPSCDTVPWASERLASVARSAETPPVSMVMPPTSTIAGRHHANATKSGAKRATITTPAFTIVAECRYAVTGVGAAIAPGNQNWNGNCADFDIAPTRTRTAPTCAVVVAGTDDTARRSLAPATAARHTNPPSITRPPPAVTSNARCAAIRASGTRSSSPIRANDITDVSSQNTKRVHTSSARTSPSIAPANSVNNPA